METQKITDVISMISNQKNIDRDDVFEAIKTAFLSAAKNRFGFNSEIEVSYNEEIDEFELFWFKEVVENSKTKNQIDLFEARDLDPECKIGDEIGIKIPKQDLTRILASAAKKIVFSRISSLEKDKIISKFSSRKGQLTTGTVKRIIGGNLYLETGETEIYLPYRNLSYRDKFRVNENVKVMIKEIRTNSYPYIIGTRAGALFTSALLREEVPEISNKFIEIKNSVRETGIRSKISVQSLKSNTDPVGVCIGIGGSKIEMVRRELRGERIDIVQWDEDNIKYICNILTPVPVLRVLVDEENNQMDIVVPDDQLSIAIGKSGTNIKLSSKLIGWRLNPISKSGFEEEKESVFSNFRNAGIENELAIQSLFNAGIKNVQKFREVDESFLLNLPGVSKEMVSSLRGNKVKI